MSVMLCVGYGPYNGVLLGATETKTLYQAVTDALDIVLASDPSAGLCINHDHEELQQLANSHTTCTALTINTPTDRRSISAMGPLDSSFYV